MITIRRCTPADRAPAWALLAAQLEEHALPTVVVDTALDGALADASRALVFLAEDGGVAVGVAWLSFTWALEHGGKTGWLEELYVVPPRRNQGIGAKLLSYVLEEARALGCRAIDLEVEVEHARAEHLYARANFRPHTRARWVRRLVDDGTR
jgi:GNAT superfamily N-acetyltransferase